MIKNKKAFTLVELLIGMGIFSILIVILSQVVGEIITMKLKGEAVSSVSVDSRYLLTRLAYDVARSSNISVPSSDILTLTIDGHFYTYRFQNNNLTLSYDGGSAELLNTSSTKLTNLVFTKLNNLGSKQNVQIDLNIATAILIPGGTTESRHLITTYATRF